MSELNVRSWGDGDPAVLVHGSISTGEQCWQAQRPLAEEGFRLVVPDRRGYGPDDELVGEDFSRDAEEIADLLGDGAHLVGHSYGGVAVLLAAAARPEAVRSLAVIEPPAFSVALEEPAVSGMVDAAQELWARSEGRSDREFLEDFLLMAGAPLEEMPPELLDLWTAQVGPLRDCRQPWEAEIPLAELASAPFPKLVFSGGHHPAFDAVCDGLTSAIGARRTVITGAGHEVQSVDGPFNDALLDLWRAG